MGQCAIEGVVGGDEGLQGALQHHRPRAEIGEALHHLVVQTLHGFLPGGREGPDEGNNFLWNGTSGELIYKSVWVNKCEVCNTDGGMSTAKS